MLLLQSRTGKMQAEPGDRTVPRGDKFLLPRRALKEEIQLVHNATMNQPRRTQN